MDGPVEQPRQIARRHAAGCFAIAALGLAGAVLCIALGVRCAATNDAFNCIGLLTVFPAAFLAIGLIAFAVGWRRFVREPEAPARRPFSLDGREENDNIGNNGVRGRIRAPWDREDR